MSVKKKNETMAIKSLNNEPSIFDETDPNFYKKKKKKYRCDIRAKQC